MEALKVYGWQNRSTSLERNVVNLAACGGHINALEWAWDQGWYVDGKESCMSAAMNGHLHVLQWLREDGAAWDGRVISYAEDRGYNYVVEWARENGCPEPGAIS
jgi:hypothetical protein